ncbi:TrbG/VirB9 family P-type conjugative transfer protein [Sphingomonas sp. Leaf10]|uniref:TrbG/VirB9 family P-type conjugative transfer protein n=1 Tax=Sphingomonas sp. Leaf10 TaxID=1735676 RepID=UPI0006FBAAC2|nr:TrbG/VirB9 family P-type conjugative transfer protein [Sphingomonas sp. Leaf10]KQM41314.1 hypothetical protein ASE59_03290 [Sphingomonas sp. Leaf10]
MRAAACVFTLLFAPPAVAQGDPRLRSVPYVAEAVTVLKVVPGFVATVVLSPDEQVESIAVGNSAAWEVTASKSGDHLFVRPLTPGVTTNVEVVTDTRHYSLLLQSTVEGDPEATFQLRFDTAPAAAPAAEPVRAVGMPGRYRLSGSRLARPVAISDDGERTQLMFDASATLPAIYARDAQGHETLVSMRRDQDVWVIDRVWPRYVFRLGAATAEAKRVTQ